MTTTLPAIATPRRFRLAARIAAVLAMAFWWGGLTFYGLVVVPIGVDVLGGATEQGFVTRQVSNWINLSGAVTLVVLLIAGATTWNGAGRIAKATLAVSWLVMAAAQTVLAMLHPRLNAMLNIQSQSISDPATFHPLHEFYLTVTGVQWFAGLLHLLVLLAVWQIEREPRKPHSRRF
jgi:hypothetical protein